MWNAEQDSVQMSDNIVSNIASCRKIFRFLKFLEQVRKMYDYYQVRHRKSMAIKVVSYARYVCAFFYFLSDNIVWLADMGIIEKIVFQ